PVFVAPVSHASSQIGSWFHPPALSGVERLYSLRGYRHLSARHFAITGIGDGWQHVGHRLAVVFAAAVEHLPLGGAVLDSNDGGHEILANWGRGTINRHTSPPD